MRWKGTISDLVQVIQLQLSLFFFFSFLDLVAVLLVVKSAGLLRSRMFGSRAVESIESLGLEQLIGLSTGETGKHLLGKLVLITATGLVLLHRFKGRGTGDGLVSPLGVMGLAAVNLIVSVLVSAEHFELWVEYI